MSFSVTDWYAIDENGNELNGKTHGAFNKIKGKVNLSKLWINYNGVQYYAPNKQGDGAELLFSIICGVTVGKGQETIDHKYKLTARYSNCDYNLLVLPNGDSTLVISKR